MIWLVTLYCAALLIPLSVRADEPPPSAFVEGLVGHPQEHSLSCESGSATDLAAFWGVGFTEDGFFRRLPKSDNPNQGFVGDVDLPPGTMPPAGYGVYAGPVAANLRSFGLDAVARREWSLEGLKTEVAAGRPVIVWATYDMRLPGVQTWVSSDGASSVVVQWQHTFIAVGYDDWDHESHEWEHESHEWEHESHEWEHESHEWEHESHEWEGTGGLYLVDAYDAATKFFPYRAFDPAWEQLGRIAVTVEGPLSQPVGRAWRMTRGAGEQGSRGAVVVDGRWLAGPE